MEVLPQPKENESRPVTDLLRSVVRRGREMLSRVWGSTWPILLGILSPAFWLVRTVLKYWIIYQVYRRTKKLRADPKMMCPGCGWQTRHEYKYDSRVKMLIHACPRCKAEWGQAPFTPADRWDLNSRRPQPRQQQVIQGEETENEQ